MNRVRLELLTDIDKILMVESGIRGGVSQISNRYNKANTLLRKLNGLSEGDPLPKRGKVEKLLTTLEDKHKYTVHIKTLRLYLSLGLELTVIHRILKFTQEASMKIYIDKNTELRRKATSTFQKNFFKLMNNSVFGKVSCFDVCCL